MSQVTFTEVVAREEHSTVIRIGLPMLVEGEQLAAVREAIAHEAGADAGTLILDLRAVRWLDSAALGWFISLRNELIQRGRAFQPPSRRGTLLACFTDAAAALEMVRQGGSDPLLLCGVCPEVNEILVVS